MRLLAVCLFSLVLAAPGCSSGRNYGINRVADLGDILRLHGMAGPGAGVKLEATRLLHAGLLYEKDVYAWGVHDRAIGPWRETVFSWGILVGHHGEEMEGIPRLTGDYGWSFADGEGGIFQAGDEDGQLSLDLLTVRGSAMMLIGIDLEVRVGEVLDFVAGIFQFDPAGDDIDYDELGEPDLSGTSGRDDAPDLGDGDYDYTIQ